MSRAVYIGGFGNGQASAERVAEALTAYGYSDVDPFTFSQAMGSRDEVRQAVRRAAVFTHSAGMLAVVGSWPESIAAFNGPLPASKKYLIGKTLVKTAHMHLPGRGIKSPRDIGCVLRYDASAISELALRRRENMKHLPAISEFDAYATALRAEKWGIHTDLVYTHGDDYYPGALGVQATLLEAIGAGVGYRFLPGEHDELVLRPAQTLDQYFGSSAT